MEYRNYCVYLHENMVNSRIYIGITNDIRRRWRTNGIEYKPYKRNTRPFWNAIEKYGWDNFKHSILEDNLTFEEACEKEKYYIAKYSEEDFNLYNIAEGGNGGVIYKEHPRGMKGKKQTQHQIESHREWASQKGNNCMTNGRVVWDVTHKHPRGMKGKTHSDDYKNRLKREMKENNPNAKKCKIIYPDGKVIECSSKNEASRLLNISIDTVNSICKSGKPYKLSKQTRHSIEKLKKLIGIRIIENTEVNNQIAKG
ncbi:GIY-YIG nuclease family protein [Bacillus paramycoides]|uniref:GIY-YIG nuclease family protein n=1 Tax=Bacillus paramycoides TaxID=2026194 RepID=UPI002E22A99B|nr:GIY-YIG nuclease family protein [Bacillus paramycoides]